MKIFIYGNQGNLGFRMGTWLRQEGINVSLLTRANEHNPRCKPEWEEPELKDAYPDWIHAYRYNKLNAVIAPSIASRLSKEVDCILTTGADVVPALSLNKPTLFIPVGGDITILPFEQKTLLHEILSWIYRSRIGRVRAVMTAQEDIYWAARLLNLGDRIHPFNLPVDVDKLNNGIDADYLKKMEHECAQYEQIWLNPSRKNLDPACVDYKGSDLFLTACKRFFEKHPEARNRIKIVFGMHGNDVVEFKKEIEEAGLSEQYQEIEQLPLPKLWAWLKMKNVVLFDQFGSAARLSLGGVSREGLSLGVPTVSATVVSSQQFIRNYGADCPLMSACDETAIYQRMEQLYAMTDENVQHLREATAKWAWKHLHWENQIPIILERFKKILCD